jgi:hypothetical protein
MQGIGSTVSGSGERKYWPSPLSNDRLRTSIPRGRACHRRDDGGLSPAEAPPRQMKVHFGRSWGAARLISLLPSTARAIQFRAPDQAVDIARRHGRGQSLLEFALVIPILMVLLGGAVQYGVVFAAKNSLTQVVRDTARWASTQTLPQCSDAASGSPPPLLDQADQIGQTSSLIGYSAGMWNTGNFTVYLPYVTPLPASPPFGVLPATPPNSEGVEVVWSYDSGGACPPTNNIKPAYVTVRITHAVPILLPGLQYLPGLGSCGPSGCFISLWSTSEFRMEPPRQ